MQADDSPEMRADARRRRPARLSTLVAYALLGALLGSVLSGVVWVLATRDPLPELTPRRLEQARQLWRQRGPRNYEMTLVLGDPQGGERIQIRVEGGRAVSAVRRPGGELPRRVWDFWTVTGLFDILQRDLENRQNPQRAFGVSNAAMVVLRCRFDPQYGYPRQYQRVVRGRGLQSRWSVVRFRPLP